MVFLWLLSRLVRLLDWSTARPSLLRGAWRHHRSSARASVCRGCNANVQKNALISAENDQDWDTHSLLAARQSRFSREDTKIPFYRIIRHQSRFGSVIYSERVHIRVEPYRSPHEPRPDQITRFSRTRVQSEALTLCFCVSADGYYEYTMNECVYSTSDYSDMVLLNSYSFNKVVDVQYNSTVGKFVGYTEEGVTYADNFNKDQAYLDQLKAEVDRFCRHNAQIWDPSVRDKSGECCRTLLSSVLLNNDLLSWVSTCADQTRWKRVD